MLDSSSSSTTAKRLFYPGRSMFFAFVFVSFFVLFSIFSVFSAFPRNPSSLQHSQSQVSPFWSRFFSNSTTSTVAPDYQLKFDGYPRKDASLGSLSENDFSSGTTRTNSTDDHQISKKTNGFSEKTSPSNGLSLNDSFSSGNTKTNSSGAAEVSIKETGYNSRKIKSPKPSKTNTHDESNGMEHIEALNFPKIAGRKGRVGKRSSKKKKKGHKNWLKKINHCSYFRGRWVKDDRQPLYEPGSCPFIDESFNCFLNGKPENAYERYRWQPDDCDLPRWNGKKMLQLLRGKRLVYVGDSLNRNMWESMVCLLRNSVHNKSNVYEANHRKDFRSQGSYSFRFEDYNFTVEFIRSPFLVQEWEMPDTDGSRKETLRLDLVERSSDMYKGADILVFNTGHWWTHEKTSAGKGYYQEGDHVYDELHVMEAFRKAMTTWSRWIDANVNPMKTSVFFRGYSSSHFSGGTWNSGGTCDTDNEPIEKEKDLPHDNNRPIMEAVETILTQTKTPVFYLNITRMSEFRQDAHPSIYIKPNMTKEEKKTSIKFQDCSHWCLPGVPDTWNEIVYSQLLLKYDHSQHR